MNPMTTPSVVLNNSGEKNRKIAASTDGDPHSQDCAR